MELVWPEHGYFEHDTCSVQLEKENIPENSLHYLNQSHFSYKCSKKVLHRDFFILSHIFERTNPPSNIKNYVFSEYEVMFYRPKYDVVTGNFIGLYKTIGDIIVSGESEEFFIDYRYSRLILMSFLLFKRE